jgi:LAO/AO transport system kinase
VDNLDALVQGVVAGAPRALGRALSLVEQGGEAARELLRRLPAPSRWLPTVAFTGPPGAGKSTLVEQVGLFWQSRGEPVAVLAVDPSSPFSGGALLGDRLRMPRLVEAGGFVRSVATRGSLGGVSAACGDFLELLRAAPFAWALVETVGVGQDEVDVASMVDTVVLLQVPGLGDDVQLAKAGVVEVAHVFVVNKKDRPGAGELVQMLQGLVAQSPETSWRPRVLATVATTGEGVEALVQAIQEHQAHLAENHRRQELAQRRAERRLRALVGELVARRLEQLGPVWEQRVRQVADGRVEAFAAACELVEYLGGKRR